VARSLLLWRKPTLPSKKGKIISPHRLALFEKIGLLIFAVLFCLVATKRNIWYTDFMKNPLAIQNGLAFALFGNYLNNCPDFVDEKELRELTESGYITEEKAYSLLVASACGLDVADNPDHRRFYDRYFSKSIKKLNAKDFYSDPYFANINLPNASIGNFSLGKRFCPPYELMVCNDPQKFVNGVVLPCLGYFDTKFEYPAIFEGDRLWMSLLPNEITTTLPAVKKAKGKVLTYGLGLGYFAYMAARKEEVTRVTVIELSSNVKELFETFILPQFGEWGKKINIIVEDAFVYAEKVAPYQDYDYIFADIWHDPADGIDMYKRFLTFEHLYPQKTIIDYWVKDSMDLYINEDIVF